MLLARLKSLLLSNGYKLLPKGIKVHKLIVLTSLKNGPTEMGFS